MSKGKHTVILYLESVPGSLHHTVLTQLTLLFVAHACFKVN